MKVRDSTAGNITNLKRLLIWKFSFAILCLIAAGALIFSRRQPAFDSDAERWLMAHVNGECGPIVAMLSSQEKDGISLTDDQLCTVLNNRVFPWTMQARFVRSTQRSNTESGGRFQAEMLSPKGEVFKVTGFAHRSLPRSVARFSSSLFLAFAVRSRIDGSFTKDRTYLADYFDEELGALESFGVRRLLARNAYEDTTLVADFFFREKQSLLATKKYNEYIQQGMSSSEAFDKLREEFEKGS